MTHFAQRNKLKKLDECDIYIQPSFLEGLPRSVVEAMSRGCPCIGTNTGGIPELLPRECLVKKKSATDIVNTIVDMCNKSELGVFAKMNFEKSKQFSEHNLNEKRNNFYKNILDDIEK